MAKQTITRIFDDLDGGDADETLTFAVDGVAYEIDLSSKNAAKLRDFLSTYQQAGTRLGKASHGTHAQLRSYQPPAAAGNREENQKIRAWAIKNGYDLADRGRIPQFIQDAFRTNTPSPVAVKAAAVKDEVTPPRRATRKPSVPVAAFSA